MKTQGQNIINSNDLKIENEGEIGKTARDSETLDKNQRNRTRTVFEVDRIEFFEVIHIRSFKLENIW